MLDLNDVPKTENLPGSDYVIRVNKNQYAITN